MSLDAYQAWEDDPIITTVSTTALPIHDLEYPAITICGQVGTTLRALLPFHLVGNTQTLQIKGKMIYLLPRLNFKEINVLINLFLESLIFT